jgi:hypothetical protein
MAAPKGNNNALVWTKDKCYELVESMMSVVNDECEYMVSGKKVIGYKYDFIGELSLEFNVNRKTLKREILAHAPELQNEVDTIYGFMERNCYANTKKGIIKEATGIVNLKSNHNWTDRNQIDQNTNLSGGFQIITDPEFGKEIEDALQDRTD